jgi:hypothetical protein
MTLKIGITSFGSGVRGISKYEESLSNSGIIDSGLFQMLVQEMGAELIIVGAMQKRCKDIVQDGTNPYHEPWMDGIRVVQSWADMPEDLDCLVVQQGAENLRFTVSFDGVTCTAAYHVYKLMDVYRNTPVVYFQTDFGTPLWMPETYGGFFAKAFKPDALYKKRKVYVLPAGHINNDAARKIMVNTLAYRHSGIEILDNYPDIHFLTDINYKDSYPITSAPTGLAFAGKSRRFGDRSPLVRDIIKALPSEISFTLMGKWSEMVTEVLRENDVNKGYLQQHSEVLKTYNEAGFTLYITAPEYRTIRAFTSRMTDAIVANCLPIIWHEDWDVIKHQFGVDPDVTTILAGLVVEKAEDIPHKMVEFYDKDKRESILSMLRNTFLYQSDTAKENIGRKLEYIINHDDADETVAVPTEIFGLYVDGQLSARRNKAATTEEAQARYEEAFNSELTANDIYNVKMQTGLFMEYGSKETFKDVPQEWLEKTFNTPSTKRFLEYALSN